MQIYVTGTINFVRKLTKQEIKQLTSEIHPSPVYSISFSADSMELIDSEDITVEIASWLKKHDNDIADGSIVKFYGDYNGEYRYKHGERTIKWTKAPIRQIDDRGRIVIPKNLRKRLGVELRDSFKILIGPDDNSIILRKTRVD